MKPRADSLYAKLTEDQRAQLYDWILTLGYPKTKERIALPEPEGFDIKTHLSCLHAFYLRAVAEQDAGHVGEARQLNPPAISELFPLAEQAAHAGAFRLTTAPLDNESFGELLPRQRDRIQFVARDFDRRRGAKSAHSRQRSVNDEQRSRRPKAPQESVFYPAVWGVSQWVSTQQANQLKRHYLRIAERNAAIAQRKAALAESRLELDCAKFRFNAARQALIHFAELAKIARNPNADDEARISAAADLLFKPQPQPQSQPQNQP